MVFVAVKNSDYFNVSYFHKLLSDIYFNNKKDKHKTFYWFFFHLWKCQEFSYINFLLYLLTIHNEKIFEKYTDDWLTNSKSVCNFSSIYSIFNHKFKNILSLHYQSFPFWHHVDLLINITSYNKNDVIKIE
jgi:hypothetical protein